MSLIEVTGSIRSVFLDNYLGGCQIAWNSTTQVDFAAGACADGSNTTLFSPTAKTKILQNSGSWTAGTGQNGLFSGARANSTWYHCFTMFNASTGAVDNGFDTDVGGANKPSGWVVRRVGSVRTDGSANILRWFQNGDDFFWYVPTLDQNGAATQNAWTSLTLSVPSGVKVVAFGAAQIGDGNPGEASVLALRSPDGNDPAPAAGNGIAIVKVVSGSAEIMDTPWGPVATNTSSQIQYYVPGSRLYVTTRGWTDNRGK